MALLTVDGNVRGHRTPATNLDRVTELLGTRWLTHDAVIRVDMLLLEPLSDIRNGAHGITFLIGGDQEANRALKLRMGRDKAL